MRKPMGFNTIRVILISLLFLALAAGAFYFINVERTRARDAKRMADMARLSSGFFEMYATQGSYLGASVNGGCLEKMPVATCALATYVPDIANFKDPGKGSYVVQTVPTETGYAIKFTLERAYDAYAKGNHLLTQSGIQ